MYTYTICMFNSIHQFTLNYITLPYTIDCLHGVYLVRLEHLLETLSKTTKVYIVYPKREYRKILIV